MQPGANEVFKTKHAVQWTRERVDRLQPAEIRQLRDNAARLNEPEVVAICDETLLTRRGAERQRPAKPVDGRKLVSKRNAFEALGVTLADPVTSWSGVRKSDGRVVVALWARAIESKGGSCRYLLWAPNAGGSRPWSDSPAGQERLEHCRRIGVQGKADGLLVLGEEIEGCLPEDRAQSIHGVDPAVAVVFTLEQRGEEYWAVWGKKAR